MPPPRDVKKQQSLNDDEKRVLADRYRFERKLGCGNFGTAFLGNNLYLLDLRNKKNNINKIKK
jgi:hypothetical protein